MPPKTAQNAQNWHVVQCIPNQQIRAVLGIRAAGITSYLPEIVIPRQVRRNGLRVANEIRVPMFGPYIFVRFALVDDWQRITRRRDGVGIDGVIRLLCNVHYEPEPIRSFDVDAFIADEPNRLKIHQKRAVEPIKRGASVKVAQGVFIGLAGVCTACDGITSTINLGGWMSETKIPRSDLEVVNGA
jgi:transcription antitermination factor NusG